MLDLTIKFLSSQLNSYLKAVTGSGSNSVEVKASAIVDHAGKYVIDENGIGATVINVEEERILKSHSREYKLVNGHHVLLEPDLKINLYVMFAANFKVYDEGLKSISHVMTFFQSHLLFTPQIHPDLDSRIEKLSVELLSLNFEQLNQIWAYIGGKHLPSAIYKMRMLLIQDNANTAIQPPLTKVQSKLSTA